MTPRAPSAHDARITRAVAAWFEANARELPWRHRPDAARSARSPRRDPYRSLVCEAMLQQTQVSRVTPRFVAFVERFPTVASLAAADVHDVLEMWSGLGYYRRARHLHAAARQIMAEFGGAVPQSVDDLRRLPGVGRYTAGSIASIVFGAPAPIVDGNVARVLLRIHGKDAPGDDPNTRAWLWERAASLATAAAHPGVFNEGLMELGATVCTPAPSTPACDSCPVRGPCIARRDRRQMDIPRPKPGTVRGDVFCASVLAVRHDGAVLLERRPETGMWAGMWQTPTAQRNDRAPTRAEAARAANLPARALVQAASFEFLATHRRMEFTVFRATPPRAFEPRRGEFVPPARADRLPMSSPQRRILRERPPSRV
ncbi:MAG TPA: A/G-specific adenine glycosylase [Phycisphaerales bacterium]|nr:A/G-specific adenine glycosylase [Phycisphaerales bacterium]